MTPKTEFLKYNQVSLEEKKEEQGRTFFIKNRRVKG